MLLFMACVWISDEDLEKRRTLPYADDTGNCDADADGAEALSCGGDDCDDGDAGVLPGATELCDGVDQDCDGSIDEDALLSFYADADADGYGDDTTEIEACSAESGQVAVGGDCDDTSGDVSPDASESCNDVDDDCDGETDEDPEDGATWYADADTDGYGDADAAVVACDQPSGYVVDALDCDDGNSGVSPDATEQCNNRDDDCDGTIDEDDAIDARTWYADDDGDGYGDPDDSSVACLPPDDTVDNDWDCDDTTVSVSPSVSESCNGIDDDCDGAIDEDAPIWYADADADGYGDAASTTQACSLPAGFVADATDCDDTSADVSPAGVETCDGVDQDCDGSTDEFSIDAPTWYADADGDDYGDAATTQEECSAPAGYVAEGTDCDDADDTVNPAAEDACNGVDDDCDGSTDTLGTDELLFYDAFSTSSNPNGDWTAGWYETAGGEVSAYTSASSTSVTGGTLDIWSDGADSEAGGFFRNAGGSSVSSGSATWPAESVTLHPGSASQIAVLRWTAPAEATCTIDVDFVGYDIGEKNVGVYHGPTEIGTGTVTAYATVTVTDTVEVDSGDTIDFTVSRGGDWAFDTTGLEGGLSCTWDACACSEESLGASTYQFCATGVTFETAAAACAYQGLELVTIDTADENSFVIGTAGDLSEQNWWIGLNDLASEGTWVWDDGSALGSYAPWHTGEPNDGAGTGEDCVEVGEFSGRGTNWNDVACTGTPYFVCESP